jgi:TetR/AcrR family transcriptional repressor of mexJK operon
MDDMTSPLDDKLKKPTTLSKAAKPVTLPATLPAKPDAPTGKSAGRPRAADIETRMQALLATAADLFLQKGYGSVSLEMIAREAHVAVRTIYVKFGGKAGLLNAIIAGGRLRHFSSMADMQTDSRSLAQILSDFGLRYLELVSTPAAIELQRMVIAEARTNPELAATFHQAGPLQTRAMLTRFFARLDIAAQCRNDIAPATLTSHLISCIMGDQSSRLLVVLEQEATREERCAQVAQGVDFFLRAALRQGRERQ